MWLISVSNDTVQCLNLPWTKEQRCDTHKYFPIFLSLLVNFLHQKRFAKMLCVYQISPLRKWWKILTTKKYILTWSINLDKVILFSCCLSFSRISFVNVDEIIGNLYVTSRYSLSKLIIFFSFRMLSFNVLIAQGKRHRTFIDRLFSCN